MDYVAPESIDLRKHADFSEAWVKARIMEDPSLLGLGHNLDVLQAERRQPKAGRLDLLLSDPVDDRWFEVELQLGPTDESHIIRTIEYWDIEKRRYPDHEHCAVIVAEDITARFLNVVSLFNGFIPLIAIQLRAFEVNGAVTLIATRVLDRMTLGNEEDDLQQAADRTFWEQKSSKESMRLVDDLLDLARTVDSELQPNYTRSYIGVAHGGIPDNWMTVKPSRQQYVVLGLRLPQDRDLLIASSTPGSRSGARAMERSDCRFQKRTSMESASSLVNFWSLHSLNQRTSDSAPGSRCF